MKASKSTISEEFFSSMLGAYRDYKDATGGEREIRLDSRVLNEVAYKGFQDLSQRLKSAGIDLNNATAIREPRIQDTIKNNTVKYVEQYMSGGESPDRQAVIIGELQKASKNGIFPDPIPTEWNKKTVFDYFLQAAKIRARVIIALDQQLPDKPQTDVDKLKELQNSLEDNKEIVFYYSTPTIINTVVIRKNGVYVEEYTGTSSSGIMPAKVSVPPHGDMFQVQRDKNLAFLYNQYLSQPTPPPPTEFEAETLE
jgi:hypothetical protein